MPFRAFSSTAGVGTAAAGALDAATQVGDIQLAFIEATVSSTTISAVPTGWTLLRGNTPSGFKTWVYWKVRQTGDSTTPTWTLSTSGGWTVDIWSGSNPAASNPINAHNGAVNTGATALAVSVTPTVADCMLVLHTGADTGTAGQGRTFTVSGSMTERVDANDDTVYRVVADQVLSGQANTAQSRTSTITGAATPLSALIVAIAPGPTTVTHDGAASVAGQASVTAGATQQRAASVAVAGTAGVTAGPTQTHSALATVAAAASVTAGASLVRPASAVVDGAAAVTATATRAHSAQAVVAGQAGVLANSGTPASAAVAAVAAVTATATQTHAVQAAAPGAAQVLAGARQQHAASVVVAGQAAVLAGAVRVQPAAVAVPGTAAVVADGRRVHQVQAAVAAQAGVQAGALLRRAASVTIAGAARVTAAARVARPGLNVSLWAVTPGGLLPLPAPRKLDFSRERNAVGSVTVEYPAGSPRAALLRAGQENDTHVEVEIWLGGSREGALRARLVQTAGDDSDARAVWSFAGGFLEIVLDGAIVYPQPPPAEKGELAFTAATAGTVMATVLNQAQARGALTSLTRDWTTTHDSSGQPWPSTVSGLKFSPKTTLLQVAQELDSLDMADFEVTRDRVLRMWAPGRRGVDRSTGNDPATFRHGRVKGAPLRHDVRNAGTSLLVLGADGKYAEVNDASALARRGERIERAVDAGQLTDTSALLAYGQAAKPTVTTGQREIRHDLVFGAGDPRPGAGFDIADTVISERRGGQRLAVQLQQYTLAVVAGQAVSGEVVLGDRISSRAERILKQLEAIRSGVVVAGTSSPPGTDDTIPPAAPTGVTADSLAYQDGADTVAVLLVAWAAVTTNASGPQAPKARAAELILARMQSGQSIAEDWTWAGAPAVVGAWNDSLLTDFEASGSSNAQTWLASYVAANNISGAAADDVAGYRVETAYAAEPNAWSLGVDVAGQGTTSATFGSFTAGVDMRVRVRAYDRTGNVSAPSTVVELTTEVDNEAPPVPSAPVVSPYLGQLKVAWNGLGSAGEAMPPDLDYVEVHISQASSFTPTPATLVDTFSTVSGERVITNLPYGVTHFVRFIAVDRTTPTPNRSGPSAQGSATPSKVVGDDVLAGAVGSLQLADLAAVSAKIGLLAVNDAQFGGASVGKLEAGVLNVAVTNAGIIRTGTSGARTEQDSGGFRVYNGSGTQTVALVPSGVSYVTGEFRTAMSGARFVWNPGGTEPHVLRIYPSSGSNFATITADSLLGQAVFKARGNSVRSDQSAGEVGAWPTEAFIGWAVSGTNVPFSRITCRETNTEILGPNNRIIMEERYPAPPGAGRVSALGHRTSTGVDIGQSFIHHRRGSDNSAWLDCPQNGSGLIFGPGFMLVCNSNAIAVPIDAADFRYSSARRLKRGLRPAKFGKNGDMAARDVVRGARAQQYQLESDMPGRRPARPDLKLRRLRDDGTEEYVQAEWSIPEPEAPTYVGLVADEVALVAPHLVRQTPGRDLSLSLMGVASTAWAAAADNADDIEEIRAELVALRAQLVALSTPKPPGGRT